MPGVERRMLDRIGEEVARATSIVRYAPGSHFSAHTHGGGEEFLVLEGVFQDEHGDYPPGTYDRNPPTSSHTPRSELGCTILVKLWQFDPADRTHVRIDTRDMAYGAVTGRPGVEAIPLYRDDREDVRLEHWAPNAGIVVRYVEGVELLVLEGALTEGAEIFEEQSWLRLPPGKIAAFTVGPQGCRLWVKSGHLGGHIATIDQSSEASPSSLSA